MLREVGVVIENTSDISPEMARELDIPVPPYVMITDGEQNVITLEGDHSTVIDRMAACTKFSTAGVNVNDFYTAYLDLLQRAKSLVVFTLAPGYSLTYNSAVMAAEMVEDARIKVYDSQTAYVGTRAMAIQAARRAMAGASFEEVCAFAEQAIPRADCLIVSANLAFVRAIGRLNEGRDEAGRDMRLAILRAKDGKVVPIEAAADYDEAIEKVLALTAVKVPPGQRIYAALGHVRKADAEERLYQRVRDSYELADITRTKDSMLGMLVGGIGAVGFGYCPAV